MEYLYLEKNKSQPVFVLLHGTGGDEHSLVQIGEYLNPEASLLGLRGRVKEGGANRFFRRFAEGQFDLEDLALQTDYLLTTLTSLGKEHDIPLSQMILLGYSNGANIGAHLLLTKDTPITRGIFFHAMLLEETSYQPVLTQQNVWLSYGVNDPLVSPGSFKTLEKAYGERGATITSYRSEMGHNLVESELIEAKKWLHEGGS